MNSSIDDKTIKKMVKLAHYYDPDDSHIEIDVNAVLSSDIGTMKNSLVNDIFLMITGDSGNYFFGRDNVGEVDRFKTLEYDGWSHTFSAQTYGNKMAEALKILEKTNKKLKLSSADDEGDCFQIEYSIKINPDTTIIDAIQSVRNFEEELEGQTEIMLDQQNISKDILNDEKKFTLTALLPLFRNMGYQDVQYNHGPREFGRDIIFTEIDKLGIRRNFGVQVKAGNLTGEAKSKLDELIAQVDDAFSMTHINTFSKEKRTLTDIIIAISGRYSGNAPQKILEKTERKKTFIFLILIKFKNY